MGILNGLRAPPPPPKLKFNIGAPPAVPAFGGAVGGAAGAVPRAIAHDETASDGQRKSTEAENTITPAPRSSRFIDGIQAFASRFLHEKPLAAGEMNATNEATASTTDATQADAGLDAFASGFEKARADTDKRFSPKKPAASTPPSVGATPAAAKFGSVEEALADADEQISPKKPVVLSFSRAGRAALANALAKKEKNQRDTTPTPTSPQETGNAAVYYSSPEAALAAADKQITPKKPVVLSFSKPKVLSGVTKKLNFEAAAENGGDRNDSPQNGTSTAPIQIDGQNDGANDTAVQETPYRQTDGGPAAEDSTAEQIKTAIHGVIEDSQDSDGTIVGDV